MLTEHQLEVRLQIVEEKIYNCRDSKSLPFLNKLYQEILDKLVAIDMEKK